MGDTAPRDATYLLANAKKSYCNPPGINQRGAFLMQSLEMAREKDILKICLWDFSKLAVNKNGIRVMCRDFCTLTEGPYPGT